MTQVKKTITIELEIDLVGTFVPGEAASRDCTASEPVIVDLNIVGIRGERQSRVWKSLSVTETIFDGNDGNMTVQDLLDEIIFVCEPEVELLMIDDAIRGIAE